MPKVQSKYIHRQGIKPDKRKHRDNDIKDIPTKLGNLQ